MKYHFLRVLLKNEAWLLDSDFSKHIVLDPLIFTDVTSLDSEMEIHRTDRKARCKNC